MAKRRRKAYTPNNSIVVPDPLIADMKLALALLRAEQGRQYFEVGLCIWKEVGRRCLAKRWADVPDQTIVALAFGADPEVNRAVMAFLPAQQPSDVLLKIGQADADRQTELRFLVLIAYLARAATRPDLDVEMLTSEMGAVWTWLFCHDELVKRLAQHSIGALLYALTVASRRQLTPLQGALDKAAQKWVSAASRDLISYYVYPRGGRYRRNKKGSQGPNITLSWTMGILGEVDIVETKKEVRGLLGKRLAQEIQRRCRDPSDVLSLQVIQGRLNWHKKAAKDVVLDMRRPDRERHTLADDLEAVEEANLPAWREESFLDPDEVANQVAHDFKFTNAEGRVLRCLCRNPEGQYSDIAQEAKVSERTVQRTILKIRTVGRADLERMLS